MESLQKTLIKKIYDERAKDDENTKTLAGLVQELIISNLSGDKYLNELLQNADDAGSVAVEFILSGNYLIFKHQGKHFDENDVKAIANAASPKRKKLSDNEQIGNKGIGFKAVFSMASSVTIISNGYSFRFDESFAGWQGNAENFPWQIIPIWTDLKDLPELVRTNYDEKEVTFIFHIRPELVEEITTHLQNLRSRHLLFLRHVKSFTYTIKTDSKDEIKKITLSSPQAVFQIKDKPDIFTINKISIDEKDAWYVYKTACLLPKDLKNQLVTAKDIPRKYKSLQSLPISIAVLASDQQLESVTEGHKVFCYLPTNINFGLKFVINAEFLLESSRMNLRDGAIADAWNGFILENIYFEHIRFLSVLGTRSFNLWTSIFEVLTIPSHLLLKKFQEGCQRKFKDAIQSFPLVKNILNNQIKLIKDIGIDRTNFINSFGTDELKATYAHNQIENQELLKKLKGTEFTLTELINNIKQPWFLTRINTPETNKKFIEFTAKLFSNAKDPVDKDILKTTFCSESFILSTSNNLKKPTEIFFPDDTFKFLTAKFNFVDIVHAVLNQSAARPWLESMGVSTLQLNNIISKANEAKNELVKFTLHLAVSNIEFDKDAIEKLKGLKVKTRKSTIVATSDCYLPEIFKPKVAIESFLSSNSAFLLHQDYLQSDGDALKKLLLTIGVQKTITLENLKQIVAAVNTENSTEKLIAFTQFIFKQFFDGKTDTKQKAFIAAIKELKLVSHDNKILAPADCYLADCYSPEFPLQQIVSTLNYISSNYINTKANTADWANLFKSLGVKQKIHVEIHQSPHRDTLIKNDKENAPVYFEYLKSQNNNLFPWETRKFMHQHYLEGAYVQIEFAEILVTTPIFWKLLLKHWQTFAEDIKEVEYHTQRSCEKVPSNIHYLVEKAIKAAYGEDKKPADYYGYEVKEKLGDYAEELAIATETKGFHTEQLSLLGFKSHLSLTDCQILLNNIAKANRHHEDFEKIIFIYRNLLKCVDGTEKIAEVNLLNQCGEFTPSTNLHFIVGDYLPYIRNQHLVKKPETFRIEEFRKICTLMDLTFIHFNELQINIASEIIPSDLYQHINQRLLYIVYLEAHKKDWLGENLKSNGTALYQTLYEKLAALKYVCAERFQVVYKTILNEHIEVWIDREQLRIYHCPLSTLDIEAQQELYQFIHTYLALKCEQKDFVSIITSPENKLNRKYQHLIGDFTINEFSNINSNSANTKLDNKKKRSRAELTPDIPNSPINEDPALTDLMQIESSPEEIPAPKKAKLNSNRDYFSNYNSTQSMVSSSAGTSTATFEKKNAEQLKSNSNVAQGGFFSGRFTKEQLKAIGREGEQAVYDFLLKQHTDKHGEKTIKPIELGYIIQKEDYSKAVNWMNKNSEQYKAYDFEIIVTKNGQQKIRHLEVKTSTTDDEKIDITYSAGEWQQMEDDEKQSTKSHRLFVVKAQIDNAGELVINNNDIHKIDLLNEIKDKNANVADMKRVTLNI